MFSGIDDPSRWVLPAVLHEMAKAAPGKDWIRMTSGGLLSFSSACADMDRVSGYLNGLDIRRGDYVAVLMSSSLDFVRVWLGITRLGAVAVLLNPELSGSFLSHQLNTANANIAIVDDALVSSVEAVAVELRLLKRIVVVRGELGQRPDSGTGVEILPWDDWTKAQPWDGPMPAHSDISTVMYTSGTSGPSKAVLMPHAHCTLFGIGLIEATGLSPDDIYYVTMPLFHANGLLMQLGSTLLCGATAVVRPRFSASSWLSDIKLYEVTVTSLLGSMSAFVVGRQPSSAETDHRLRAIVSSPNMPEHDEAFRGRFGIADVISGFGMTEANICVWGCQGRKAPGAAGWVYARYFEVIIADPDTDVAVEPGEVGEILVRPKIPFGFMAGYLDMPEKTVEAWRNLWFHTGDAATMSEDGLLIFIDRIKDCIRRRGENIAPTEIEAVVKAIHGISDVTAYAVPSDIPGGEDEIMLAIVPEGDTSGLLSRVADEADRLLPRFARPRYLKLFDDFPRTATGKVQRAVLRDAGSSGALDREDKAHA